MYIIGKNADWEIFIFIGTMLENAKIIILIIPNAYNRINSFQKNYNF